MKGDQTDHELKRYMLSLRSLRTVGLTLIVRPFQSVTFLSGNTALLKALHTFETPATHHSLILYSSYVSSMSFLHLFNSPHPTGSLLGRKVSRRDGRKKYAAYKEWSASGRR